MSFTCPRAGLRAFPLSRRLSFRSINNSQTYRNTVEMAAASTQGTPSSTNQSLRFIDIGVNLTDPVFKGKYHGKKMHEDDLELMLERARTAGVKSMIITGGSLQESRQALDLAKKHGLFATVGCHPTRSKQFEQFHGGANAYLNALDRLIGQNLEGNGRVVAIGECGLDYDRTHFASPETQKKYFRMQLGLAKQHHLPLFLHSRAAHSDFVQILREEGFGTEGGKAVGGKGGVVHSFTGSVAEVEELSRMGFHFSVNGCSMKTEENLKAVKAIALDRLLLETDAPWCTLTATHASRGHLSTMPASLRASCFPPSVRPENFVTGKVVKGRNEPIAIIAVAWVVHSVHDIPIETVAETTWKNTVDVFGLGSDTL